MHASCDRSTFDAEESTEADAELQIVTEVWVEPQYGQIANSAPERRHFDGISYQQLPQAVSHSSHSHSSLRPFHIIHSHPELTYIMRVRKLDLPIP